MNEMDFAAYSGKGVRVAVIDTGVAMDHPNFRDVIIYPLAYRNNEIVPIESAQQKSDHYGHGTACCGIILKKAPCVTLFSIQALDENGMGSPEGILISLKWCLDNAIDIINLSLGSVSASHAEAFLQLGKIARDRNVIIFASYNDQGYDAIPASLENYIGVNGAALKGKYTYLWDDKNQCACAHGGRQRVAWPTHPFYIFESGNSFATAHMSGIMALIKQAYPDRSADFYLNLLRDNGQIVQKTVLPEMSEALWDKYNSDVFPINKAVIFAYTKEMHALLRYPDLTNIQIVGICDHVRTGKVGQKVIYGGEKLTIMPMSVLDKALANADTLIVSRTSQLSEMLHEDILPSILETAVDNMKNIYSLEYIDYATYPRIYNKAKVNGLSIRHPSIGPRELAVAKGMRSLYGHLSDSTPIVGVFGTGRSQGKFSMQLELRRLFIQNGYDIKNVGTEMHSELFGFESYYPMEIMKSIRFSQWEMMEYLQGEIRRLELTKPKVDLMIVGSQSGTIPKNYLVNSPVQTLPSIAFLMGTVPHAYVLVVNAHDDEKYILDTIAALHAIGKGRVIAISFPCWGNASSGIRCLGSSQSAEVSKRLESITGIPTIGISSESDYHYVYRQIVGYFSQGSM